MLRKLLATTATVTAAAFVLAPGAAQASTQAVSFSGWPAAGTLVSSKASPSSHFCSASVVHSSTQDLIITAAHCVAGGGVGISFIPQYQNGREPYGAWAVTKIYETSAWKSTRTTTADVAILRVAKKKVGGTWRGVESYTGGYRLSTAPPAGSTVSIAAYNDGAGLPVKCSSRVTYTSGYPTFSCGGYNGGTSGAGWIQTVNGVNYVRGVIGGLHQGGCVDYISYTSPFNSATLSLLTRAQANGAGDMAPAAGSDGC